MSLTSIIKQPNVKELFKQYYPLKSLKVGFEKQPIIVSPVLSDPLKSTEIGMAFDYLLRFMIERQNPQCVTCQWIAEHVVDFTDKSVIMAGIV